MCRTVQPVGQTAPGIRTTMEIYAHLDMTVNRYIPGELADLKDF